MGSPLSLTDTHCHIHEADYPLDADMAYQQARHVGVSRMICVGTGLDSSRRAAHFAETHPGVWASLALHPHEATALSAEELAEQWAGILRMAAQKSSTLVAIGECGLDYYYHHTPEAQALQKKLLGWHLALAQELDLPVIFHVRNAFADFWPIFDEYSAKKPMRGVLHSFTDTADNAAMAMERGLFIGVNGISTFTKDSSQQQLFATIPLRKLLLETDAPYLTPIPIRGSVNEPAYVMHIARFHASIRGVSMEAVATATNHNATQLFSI